MAWSTSQISLYHTTFKLRIEFFWIAFIMHFGRWCHILFYIYFRRIEKTQKNMDKGFFISLQSGIHVPLGASLCDISRFFSRFWCVDPCVQLCFYPDLDKSVRLLIKLKITFYLYFDHHRLFYKLFAEYPQADTIEEDDKKRVTVMRRSMRLSSSIFTVSTSVFLKLSYGPWSTKVRAVSMHTL